MRWLLRINILAIVLALCVIPLGAYTRLTDAGLGCPDWPGCYGRMLLPQTEAHINEAQAQFPEQQFVPYKARNEMVHRYIAGCLGLSVLGIFSLSLALKRERILATAILFLVCFQAALGMWTVTLKLMPLVVMGHLLGGFFLLTALVLLRLRLRPIVFGFMSASSASRLLKLGVAGMLVLLLQIALGGWMSANYAATICHQLPLCESGWQQHFSLFAAFNLPMGHSSYEYGVLDYSGRMSIHVLHRLGAMLTFVVLIGYAWSLYCKTHNRTLQKIALLIAGLVCAQFILGLINVLAYVPLFNALAHNFVAALLLASQAASLVLLSQAGAKKIQVSVIRVRSEYGIE